MSKTPGHLVQDAMEKFRGPQKQPRPQHISKPAASPKKIIHKSQRGK